MTEPVEFEQRAAGAGRSIGVVWLNRPEQLNALNLRMCELMLNRLLDWQADPGLAAVMVTGRGERAFCAGGDVAEVARQIRAGGPTRFDYGDRFFSTEYRLNLLMHRYGKPLVTVAHGATMGGGLGLSVAGSERFVVRGARLAMPEIHIGLFPDVGGGWFLNRLSAGAGALIALTGLIIDAPGAQWLGLADHLIDAGQHATLIERICALHWCADAEANRGMLHRFCCEASADAQFEESAELAQRWQPLRRLGHQPNLAAFVAELERLADADAWFAKPLANLRAGSPTGAAVTFEYLRRTRDLAIDQVLALDAVLARQFQRHHDFAEGVRALLIDKDRKADWQPKTIAEVRRELVFGHFV